MNNKRIYTYDYDDLVDVQYYNQSMYNDTIWIIPRGMERFDNYTIDDVVKTTIGKCRATDIALPTYNLVVRYFRIINENTNQ